MKDETKEMILAGLGCLLVFSAYLWYQKHKEGYQPDPQFPQEVPTQQDSTTTQPTSSPSGSTASQDSSTNTIDQPGPSDQTGQPVLTAGTDNTWQLQLVESTQADILLGDHIKSELGFKAELILDPRSAALKQVLLSEYKYKVTDEQTGYPVMAPADDLQNRQRFPLQLGKLKFKGHSQQFNLAVNCWKASPLQTDSAGNQTAKFTASITAGPDRPICDIVKTFHCYRNSYEVIFDLQFINRSRQQLQVESLEIFGPQGILREDPRSDRRRGAVAAYWLQPDQPKVSRESVSLEKESNRFKEFEKPTGMPLRWFGVTNKFFAVIMRPLPSENQQQADFLLGGKVSVEALAMGLPDKKGQRKPTPSTITHLFMPQPLSAQQNEQSFSFAIYMGPIDRDVFEADPILFAENFRQLIYSGGCFCSFNWLTLLLLKMMKLTYQLVGNYGISIIILVLLVRFCLHPISKKGQINMMKMGKIGPKVEELKKKYGNDQKEFQKRQMELMKDQGMAGGMILGCLPMMLQMPIWIALYTAVDANVALRHHGLFPASWHWLTDLSAPDRLIPFSTFGINDPISIPFLGSMIGDLDAFNLLPILLFVAMFLQMKYSPQSKMSNASNPQAAQQQKMMMYMMPVMMLLFFYSAPSGLNLYIMASTFAGLIEQHFIRKHLKEQDAKEAAMTVTATSKIGGKLGPKKRKPKPPKKFM
ncbi:MAG: YidC/Oxa1 family insertase periplasmic-domain containing protein [Sedimentisphaerales bacterium]|nr:YidC/Oxa1 family insertase periplasmic-domain containing protein [Sedimentisphaerales bacterium]